MTKSINTHNVRLNFGKHAGELVTRVPVNYLLWMLNEGVQAPLAQAELDRRGYVPKSDMVISDHAIDRASLRLRSQWNTTCTEGEGLMSWLRRMAAEALQSAESKPERVTYQGIIFVFGHGELYPTLKTVMVDGKE